MVESARIKSIQNPSIDNSLWELTVLITQAHGLVKALELMFGDLIENHASCAVVDTLNEKMKEIMAEHQRLCNLVDNIKDCPKPHDNPI